ncbi:hypothetical protein Tco_0774130 [Tanacetum coccineum]|uniref:Uncharacterized protein n=1 Tax=Tanacetum coccineum TaxID=301880 RepID=A0ABQ4ZMP0_9ASTR
MSSMYLIMNRVGSMVPLVKPLDIRKFESLSYQALRACFNPYRAFLRRFLVFYWIMESNNNQNKFEGSIGSSNIDALDGVALRQSVASRMNRMTGKGDAVVTQPHMPARGIPNPNLNRDSYTSSAAAAVVTGSNTSRGELPKKVTMNPSINRDVLHAVGIQNSMSTPANVSDSGLDSSSKVSDPIIESMVHDGDNVKVSSLAERSSNLNTSNKSGMSIFTSLGESTITSKMNPSTDYGVSGVDEFWLNSVNDQAVKVTTSTQIDPNNIWNYSGD